MRRSLAAAALGVFLIGAAPPPSAGGYLTEGERPDTLRILPPPPRPGGARAAADRHVFLATRNLQDSPRWTLAQGDIDQGAILRDMACPLGVDLAPGEAPRLAALIRRVAPDVSQAVEAPKTHYRVRRPYLNAPGPICAPATPSLAVSPDYPSGHATWGWAVGLILAELAPDRATDILVRARAYGESRIVCGVHSLSAVEAGRTTASAVVAALHGDSAFRADLDAARAELAALRRAGHAPDAAACAAEAGLVEQSPTEQ